MTIFTLSHSPIVSTFTYSTLTHCVDFFFGENCRFASSFSLLHVIYVPILKLYLIKDANAEKTKTKNDLNNLAKTY